MQPLFPPPSLLRKIFHARQEERERKKHDLIDPIDGWNKEHQVKRGSERIGIGALCQADERFFGGNLARERNGNSRETWWLQRDRARAWTQGKEIRSMQIPSFPPSQHNYQLAEWLNLCGVRENVKKADYKAIMPETSGDANESRCGQRRERGREVEGSTVTVHGGGSSQVYNVIDSRDRNERGEAKLCRGISTIIRIISPELGGRTARQIKLPSEFEFHRCIFARIASVAHVCAPPTIVSPRKRGKNFGRGTGVDRNEAGQRASYVNSTMGATVCSINFARNRA